MIGPHVTTLPLNRCESMWQRLTGSKCEFFETTKKKKIDLAILLINNASLRLGSSYVQYILTGKKTHTQWRFKAVLHRKCQSTTRKCTFSLVSNLDFCCGLRFGFYSAMSMHTNNEEYNKFKVK